MATANGPNLAAAVAAVERLMDDTCEIYPVEDIEDAVLNPNTGELEPAEGRTPAYKGKCKIKQSSARFTEVGGHEAIYADYEGGVPLSAPELETGMIWKHTSSRRDSQLEDKEFKVVAVLHSSFAVQRKVLLVEVPQ